MNGRIKHQTLGCETCGDERMVSIFKRWQFFRKYSNWKHFREKHHGPLGGSTGRIQRLRHGLQHLRNESIPRGHVGL